jgi:F-type H+-transporting ATPase subunit a
VTGDIQVTAASGGGGCHIFSGCGFPAPGLQDFNFKPIFSIAGFHFTKPMLIAVICALSVIVFFWAAFAKPRLVPRGVQNLGELALLFVRDQILRPSLGKKGDQYLPFLTCLFFFIWFMNLMEIIPFFQFPATSRAGFPWSLVAMVYLTYLYIGFKNQGFAGYFKNMIPHDVPWWIYPILVPIEVARYVFIQPFTLGVRLFANMFAGHLLLLIFTIATWYMASLSIGLVFAATSFLMVLAVTVLEALIQLLQAFIFTTLTATYIADSLEAGH